MMPRRRSRAFVDDILNAIGNIEADTDGLDFDQFVADRRVRQLVERNIEIISEASRRLRTTTRQPKRIFLGVRLPGSAPSSGTIMGSFGRTSCGAF
jgi:hypothetical protein